MTATITAAPGVTVKVAPSIRQTMTTVDGRHLVIEYHSRSDYEAATVAANERWADNIGPFATDDGRDAFLLAMPTGFIVGIAPAAC